MRVLGEKAVAADFRTTAVVAQQQLNAITRLHAAMLLAGIRSAASGAPGPNVITGAYVASWSVQYDMAGGVLVAIVGTDAPQANRLEYGFFGVDSLGLSFSQPPKPHIQPAAAVVEDSYYSSIALGLSL